MLQAAYRNQDHGGGRFFEALVAQLYVWLMGQAAQNQCRICWKYHPHPQDSNTAEAALAACAQDLAVRIGGTYVDEGAAGKRPLLPSEEVCDTQY